MQTPTLAQTLTLTTPEEAEVRICGDCNARNNDSERFCSNCGAYLVWQQGTGEGEAKLPPRTATTPATGQGAAVTTAQLPVVPEAPGVPRRGRSGWAGGEQRNPASPAGVTPGAASAGNARAYPPESFGATATVDPASADGLQGRQPRQSDGRPPRDAEPHLHRGDAPRPLGGLTCRRCGADNKPEASFCRQCGAGLREAAVVPIPPWWRQLLSRSTPAALPAGSRPQWRKQRKLSTGTVSLLTVTGLFAGVAFLGMDVITRSVVRAADEMREIRIGATTIGSSPSAGGRGAERAFDDSVRSWASDGAFEPGADYLEAGFDPPFHLTYVVITGVAPGTDKNALREQWPAKVEIVATRRDGHPSTLTVDILDVDGPKNFYFGADDITTVRLNILETRGPAGTPVSVAEVRFAGWRW